MTIADPVHPDQKSVLSIHISLNADPDPAFLSMRIRIQGLLHTLYREKKIFNTQ